MRRTDMTRNSAASSFTPVPAPALAAAKKTGGLTVVKPPTPAVAVVKPASSGLTVVKQAPKPKAPISFLETPEGLKRFTDQTELGRLDYIDNKLVEIFNVVEGPASEKQIEVLMVDMTVIFKTCGMFSLEGGRIMEFILNNITAHGALNLLSTFIKEFGSVMEPFIVSVLPQLLVFHADRSKAVRDHTAAICTVIAPLFCPHTFRIVYPILTEGMLNEDWKIKVAALQILRDMAKNVSEQITPLLPTIIPQVTECFRESKRQVQLMALEALLESCRAITNDDIRGLVPQLVSVIAHPDETEKTVNSLLETTFVSVVDEATLALIAPLLGKALRGRSSVLKRKAARIIDNMCRLVQQPRFVAPFVSLLMPALDRVIEEVCDKEICDTAIAAKNVLLRSMGGEVASVTSTSSTSCSSSPVPSLEELSIRPSTPITTVDVKEVHRALLAHLQGQLEESLDSGSYSPSVLALVAEYVSNLSAHLIAYNTPVHPSVAAGESLTSTTTSEEWRYTAAMTSKSEWDKTVLPFFRGTHKSVSFDESFSRSFRKAAMGAVPDYQEAQSGDDSNLCDFEFSLAFGGKILLHKTFLRLGIGRKYGVMAKNGMGKTTLLTNIGSGHIDGLPAHLRTVYVQHDDATEDHGVPLLDEIMAGADMIRAEVTREDAEAALRRINFTTEMLTSPRSCLSGGWKMKVLIIRAILSKANVLLLDEPTNHLDAASVQWLITYLQQAMDITCLIVSHDTKFLDAVVTDIIHYEEKKLVYYKGNLTHFVQIHPEALYYYELDSSTLKFVFPTPERLDGVNSLTRSILKMDNITYTYPGASQPTLVDVSVKLCLASRVAVTGINGAGKSTLIKLLVQETQPDEGSGKVWKHHNLRVAYVAQHSFHHIEQHLDQSPVDYIKWRFSGGVDKEDLARPTMKLTEEEVETKKTDLKYGDVLEILGRRKLGHSMEYECTFHGQTQRDPNKYILLETLIERGYSKLVQQCDTRIAAMAAGLDLRPLLTTEIQGHLNDFNLDDEYGTHGSIKRLSGGQKVKLVLAAAMWNKPHVIVLDEPTNYLDREALGALTQAIKSFSGGVIIISHNQEFTDTVCTEKWIVEKGKCITKGGVSEDESTETSGGKSNIRKSKSNTTLSSSAAATAEAEKVNAGNVNDPINNEILLNPKTFEGLSKKELRLLTRCAEVAGVPLKEYLSKITYKSPEWKWL